MKEKFPWFSARLLFEAGTDDGKASDLYEERIVLLRADDGMEAAEKKARKIGKGLSHSYAAADGTNVQWRFVEVLDIVQINELAFEEGAEVYYHFLTADEAGRIRESLKASSLG